MFRSGVVKAALAVLASVGLFFFAINAALAATNSTAAGSVRSQLFQ